MINKIITAAAIVLLLLFCFIGWLEYRQYQSYKVPVPANIHRIARISTDAIIKRFIKESGFDLLRKDSSYKKRKAPKQETGIYLPANILLYDLQNAEAETMYFSIPLRNPDQFKAFAQARWQVAWRDSAGFALGMPARKKFAIACSEAYASFAIGNIRPAVFAQMMEIQQSPGRLKQMPALWQKIGSSADHICITDGKFLCSANFYNNQFLIKATIQPDAGFNIVAGTKIRTTTGSSLATVVLNASPKRSWLKNAYKLGNYSLVTDSILKYYEGYADLHIGAALTQPDTIISYDYNEDFIMTEKKEIKAVSVPNVQLTLKASHGLLRYLQAAGFVTSDMRLNKELFPLYQVYVHTSPLYTSFSTTTRPGYTTNSLQSSPYFLKMDADLQQTFAAFNLPSMPGIYPGNLTHVRLRAALEQHQILADGSFEFDKPVLTIMRKALK